MENILQTILSRKSDQKKQFAVLIDPDNYKPSELIFLATMATKCNVDYFFIGGSLLTADNLNEAVIILKEHCSIPVVIFPGNTIQICAKADGILFLSVISGRNPEMLIGKHVIAAPILKKSKLEVIATGYMLIESGKSTTALYMSNTNPIPAEKPEIAVCTAIAGEMLGMQLIYLEAGSGAERAVPENMISKVRENISIPLIVGGGIATTDQARKTFAAGADLIVIGNAIENNVNFIEEIAHLIQSEFNSPIV